MLPRSAATTWRETGKLGSDDYSIEVVGPRCVLEVEDGNVTVEIEDRNDLRALARLLDRAAASLDAVVAEGSGE